MKYDHIMPVEQPRGYKPKQPPGILGGPDSESTKYFNQAKQALPEFAGEVAYHVSQVPLGVHYIMGILNDYYKYVLHK